MNIYGILKESLGNEGSEKIWCITKMLSDCVEEYVPEKQKDILKTKIYYSTNGGHFDEDFADEAISKFYYNDGRLIHRGPYWTEPEVKLIYDRIRSEIPDYNFYDFEVTLNMIKSDNYLKLKRWFPQATEEELTNKMVEEAVNYLKDDDNPYGTEKIWRYLNS